MNDAFRIAALNVQHGGGRRIQDICTYVAGLAPDVLILSEFRKGPTGDNLLAACRSAGLRFANIAQQAQGANTVMVASRRKHEVIRLRTAPIDRHRIAAIRLGDLTIAGAYFSLGKEKASLFDFLLVDPPELDGATILMGDFNTGLHHVDENGATFDCADRFKRLGERRLRDLWRLSHGPEAREYTWISGRGGAFRLDHAFGSGQVVDRLQSCTYDHSTREKLTDHSAMIIELAARDAA